MPIRRIVFCILFASASLPVWGQDLAVKTVAVSPGDRIAIVGDSITEQKIYSKFMEAYLLACSGVSDLHVFQFGWGGEQAGGFAARMENDLDIFRPTIASLCYGMNDGGYQPYRDEVGKNYENNMRSVLGKFEKLGVKTIVVGSPGAVDTHFFRPGQMMGNQTATVAYNDNLSHLRDIGRALAGEKKLLFADVHATMFDAMTKAQATLGKEYDVCGRDGFHPGNNGQLLMAYAFLKGLGLNGDIGEISVDLKGKSSASAGHSVTSSNNGTVEIESARWPFCFQGDGKSSSSTRSIVPFTEFNSDLNRFVLKVDGLESTHATVQWGDAEKKFTREELSSGINLSNEFSETPFNTAFESLLDVIAKKQNFETYMIKTIITDFRSFPEGLAEDSELQAAVEVLRNRLATKHRQLDEAVQAKLIPVKHSIKVSTAD